MGALAATRSHAQQQTVYNYDALGRLVTAGYSNGVGAIYYRQDGADNRTRVLSAPYIGKLIYPNGFDPSYYLLTNADVLAAKVDPVGHYEAYGWRESRNGGYGPYPRNPSAFFNGFGYLNAYQDVKGADMNPLFHYDTWGRHERRDPPRLAPPLAGA